MEPKQTISSDSTSSSFSQKRLSKNQLVVFAIIFALIGGYFVFRSFAAVNTASCTKTISPGSGVNVGTEFSTLLPGQTLCLKTGTYGNSTSSHRLSKSGTTGNPVTLTTVPGEAPATIEGEFITYNGDNVPLSNITISHLNFKSNNTNHTRVNGTAVGCNAKGVKGIVFWNTSNLIFEYNDVSQASVTDRTLRETAIGFHFGGTPTTNIIVRNNKIHDFGACNNFDHGIYTGNSNNGQIYGNHIYNEPCSQATKNKNPDGTVDTSRGCGSGIQIYPDSNGFKVHGNIIDSTGQGFHLSDTNNEVYNNVIINQLGHYYGYVSGLSKAVAYSGNEGSATNKFHDNIYFNTPGGLCDGLNGTEAGGNCTATSSNNITSDPLFVNATAHDYRLKYGSPAAGYGLWNGDLSNNHASYMLIDKDRLMSLSTSGEEYKYMKGVADKAMLNQENKLNISSPTNLSPWLTNYDIIDATGGGEPGYDSAGLPKGGYTNSSAVVAAALVYARTGDTKYRDWVIRVNRYIIGSETQASTNGTASNSIALAVYRQISGYVLAADLVGMDAGLVGSRPDFTDETKWSWKNWLGTMNYKLIRTTQNTGVASPGTNKNSIVITNNNATNWGSMASASRITIDTYLAKHGGVVYKDPLNPTLANSVTPETDLAIAVARLKLWLGETYTTDTDPTTAIPEPWDKSGALNASPTWACIPAGTVAAGQFIPVNPTSCGVKGGILPEDAARSTVNDVGDDSGCCYSAYPTWSDRGIDYSFGGYHGQLLAAIVLDRKGGYDVWNWGDKAFKRIMDQFVSQGSFTNEVGQTKVVATGNGRVYNRMISWIPQHFYGVDYPTLSAFAAESFSFTDWLYGSSTPSPPPPSVCTKTLVGTNVQAFYNSLVPGDVGCLPVGTYNTGLSLSARVGPNGEVASATKRITLRTVPNANGDRATILQPNTAPSTSGIIIINPGTNYLTLSDLKIDGRNFTNQTSVRVERNTGFIFERNDITNNNQAPSCLLIGSPETGLVEKSTIRFNTFHHCGNPAASNQDHAIYAHDLVDSSIVDNTFWSSSAYTLQIYPNSSRNYIAHNVIHGGDVSVRGGVVVGPENSSTQVSNGNIFEYNVVTNSPVAAFQEYKYVTQGNTVQYNCTYQNTAIENRGGLIVTGNVTASVPPFVSDTKPRTMHLSTASGGCLTAAPGTFDPNKIYDTAQKIKDELDKTKTGSPPPPLDTTPPTVSLASPIAGSTISSSPTTLTANAADPGTPSSGVIKVEFYQGTTKVGEDISSPYSVSWTTSSLTNGTYTLTAKAYDGAGLTTTSSPAVSVTVSNSTAADTTKPVAVWAVPAEDNTVTFSGQVLETNPATCQVNASDASGIDRVEFFVDDNPAVIETQRTAPYSCVIDTTKYSDGPHTLKAIAYDKATPSNASLTVTRSVSFKNATTPETTPPSVTINSPIAGCNTDPTPVCKATIKATATATDNVGVAGVQFKLGPAGGATVNVGSEDTVAPYEYSRNTLDPLLANGNYIIEAIARDEAGNSTTAKVTFTVNNIDTVAPNPPASLTGPTGPLTAPATVTLNWPAATDNGSPASGIKGYWVYRDGAVITCQNQTAGQPLSALTCNDLNVPTKASAYVYTVRSVDNSSATGLTSTAASPPFNVTVNSPPAENTFQTPPTATATAVSSTQINIAWSGAADPNGVKGYNVYRGATCSTISTTPINSALLSATTSSLGNTGLSPGTSYCYRVDAVDNGSPAAIGKSNPASATTKTIQKLPLFSTASDAYIRENAPDTRHGSQTILVVAANPDDRNTLLKFNVSGINGRKVTSAKLRLSVKDGSPSGGDFYKITNNSWTGSTVTWNTRPATDFSTALAKLGTVTAGQTVFVDLTSRITTDGTYGFQISSQSSDQAVYHSNDGDNDNIRPKLEITVSN